jgi:hypothetical protein
MTKLYHNAYFATGTYWPRSLTPVNITEKDIMWLKDNNVEYKTHSNYIYI